MDVLCCPGGDKRVARENLLAVARYNLDVPYYDVVVPEIRLPEARVSKARKPEIHAVLYGFVSLWREREGRFDASGYAVPFAEQEQFTCFFLLEERFSAAQGDAAVPLEHVELRLDFSIEFFDRNLGCREAQRPVHGIFDGVGTNCNTFTTLCAFGAVYKMLAVCNVVDSLGAGLDTLTAECTFFCLEKKRGAFHVPGVRGMAPRAP